MLKKIFVDMHTGKDNTTFDASKIWSSILILVLISLTIYEVHADKNLFNAMEFAAAAGGFLASFGITQRLKKDTEPG